jgi:hypothetical protein
METAVSRPMTKMRARGPIQLRQESSGPRFYVGDEGIHAGDAVVLDLGYDGHPVTFRYEWSYYLDRPVLLYAPNGRRFEVSVHEFQMWEATLPER